jgi:dimeric dUTPase (all-alpha-NTP-PPase superfamily)
MLQCGLKQAPVTEQCPVLFIDVINPPTKCKCGSQDFNAHMSQYITLSKPLKFITCTVEIDNIQINN